MPIVPDRLRSCIAAARLEPAQVDATAGLPPGTTDALLRDATRRVRGDELVLLSNALDCLVTAMTGDEGDTAEDRAYVAGANSLTAADAALVLAAVYRVVDAPAREELRRAVRAVTHRPG